MLDLSQVITVSLDMKIRFRSVVIPKSQNLDQDSTESPEMGTSTSKDNSLIPIAATIEDNVSLYIFEDIYCFKVDEEYSTVIKIITYPLS